MRSTTKTPTSARTVLGAGTAANVVGRGAQPTLSEKRFAQQVVDLARLLGWRVYRTWTSKHSPPGFPDLVLVRNGELLMVEVKAEVGKLSEDQMAWLADLGAVERVRVKVWRPSNWDALERVLKGAE